MQLARQTDSSFFKWIQQSVVGRLQSLADDWKRLGGGPVRSSSSKVLSRSGQQSIINNLGRKP